MKMTSRSVAVAIIAAACGGSPTGPTDSGTPAARISRTKYFAFGDSFTAGEVTNPVQSSTARAPLATKLVLVPSASYPAVLQSRLQSAYPAQASDINVVNAGEPGEKRAVADLPSAALCRPVPNGMAVKADHRKIAGRHSSQVQKPPRGQGMKFGHPLFQGPHVAAALERRAQPLTQTPGIGQR